MRLYLYLVGNRMERQRRRRLRNIMVRKGNQNRRTLRHGRKLQQNLLPLVSLLGFMRIYSMLCTSVRFALVNLDRGRAFGHAGCAGRCSI